MAYLDPWRVSFYSFYVSLSISDSFFKGSLLCISSTCTESWKFLGNYIPQEVFNHRLSGEVVGRPYSLTLDQDTSLRFDFYSLWVQVKFNFCSSLPEIIISPSALPCLPDFAFKVTCKWVLISQSASAQSNLKHTFRVQFFIAYSLSYPNLFLQKADYELLNRKSTQFRLKSGSSLHTGDHIDVELIILEKLEASFWTEDVRVCPRKIKSHEPSPRIGRVGSELPLEVDVGPRPSPSMTSSFLWPPWNQTHMYRPHEIDPVSSPVPYRKNVHSLP